MSSLNFCEEAAMIIRKSAGWNFANILFTCFGQTSITLQEEGADGADLTFSVDEKWLLINHPFPDHSPEEYKKLEECLDHAKKCEKVTCQEAICRVNNIAPYLRKEKIPGGDALLMLKAVFPFGLSFTTSRENALPIVEELKPFLSWFNNEPDLWTE